MRRVRDVGEFGLIDRIARLAGPHFGRDVALGIGDDAAVLRPRRGEDVVVTTDASHAGVHFDLAQESPTTAGRRAAVACLSDLAAMGARPLGLLLALAAPPAAPLAQVLALVRGVVREGAAVGASLAGGNVTRARDLALTLTAVGAVAPGRALRRDAGRAGDRLYVTGPLGQGALERARGRVRHVAVPRITVGRRLTRLRGVGACIDLSDGLVADLGHVCRASGLAARLDAGAVPRPRGFDAACRRLGLAPERLVLSGGEDYELLFSVRRAGPDPASLARRLGCAVHPIGVLEAGRPRVRGVPSGASGWRHF